MNGMDRKANLSRLASDVFDVLVIGGGATGCGVALDAASRGLRTALVEAGDFSSGASSRSTKLVHGGVRYLERAVTHLDRAQFHLVREALAERAVLLEIAPHLVQPIRIVVPAYSFAAAAFYRIGLWLYDRAAGDAAIGASRFISRSAMLRSFPSLRQEGLRGGVAYYDGQFDDARMNVALAVSSAAAGAVVANYVCVSALPRPGNRVTGAIVRDMIGGATLEVRARCVVNATGAFSDTLRRMEDPGAEMLLAPSRGTHVAFPASWVPAGDALLIPRTPDKRIVFFIPWENRAIAGTTDLPAKATAAPEPTEEEIDYLLQQLSRWFKPAPTRKELLSAWAGLRPLVADTEASRGTAKLVREHHIGVGPAGMITIAGGKWTTYRLMAEETVNRVVAEQGFPAGPCCTRTLHLVGADGYAAELGEMLALRYELASDIATHLAHAYGGQAEDVLGLAPGKPGVRLAGGYPYVEAEVVWAVRREMAVAAEDVLARRLRLAFLDREAAAVARPRVEQLMAETS